MKTGRWLLVGIAIAGTVIGLFATSGGVGVREDTMVYFDVARSLVNGDGLTYQLGGEPRVPLIRKPPVFSALLAFFSLFGTDPWTAARWLNTILLGANILLVGLIIARHTGGITVIATLGSLLMLTSINVLYMHVMALSDAAFLFFSLLGLLLLDVYLTRDGKAILIAAGGAIAMSFGARYVGVTAAWAGIAVILFVRGVSIRKKLTDSLILGAVACLPVGIFVLQNSLLRDNAAPPRPFRFHPISLHNFEPALVALKSWFLPENIERSGAFLSIGVVLLIAAVVIWILSILASRRGKQKKSPHAEVRGYPSEIPALFAWWAVMYVAFFVLTVMFFDADLNEKRYATPVLVCAIIIGSCWVFQIVRGVQNSRSVKMASLFLALTIAGWYGITAFMWVTASHRSGHGYARRSWRNAQIVQKVKMLPKNLVVNTNSVAPVYFNDPGRPFLRMPQKFDGGTREQNPNYLSELEVLHRKLHSCEAVLVWFTRDHARWYMASEEEMTSQLNLVLVESVSDGSIYAARDCLSRIQPNHP